MKRVLIVGLLIFCFKSFAQTPVEIHQGGSVVSTSNPFYVTFSGDIEIDTAILQDILEQLEKNTYTGDYLNVRFNNTTIGATQSGTWNIGSITTLPSVTIGSMPAVTASNLDIRDLTSASDSVKVEGGNTADVKVTLDSESVAVTGTFWQETQPVSGSVSVSNFPGTQPVSGTVDVGNFPITQAVSGSITVNNFPETQPVSVASMPTTPVTGTFWQSTQPISAASLPLPSGAASEAKLNILVTYIKKLYDTVNADTEVDVNIKNTSITVNQDTATNLKTEPNLTDLTYSDTMSYVTCADSGLWYSFSLPAKTVAFTLHARTGYDIKISKDSDGTQYWTIWAGESFPPTPVVREGYVSGTYYVNSPSYPGLVVEAWIRKED